MLVGVHGYKGAGKDSFLDRARLAYPSLPFERLKFADALYDSAAAALGVKREWLEAEKNRDDSGVRIVHRGADLGALSVRRFLEQYGDEAHRRVFGQGFWVDWLEREFQVHAGRVLVVTDMRYPNEVDAVKKAGGVLVKVTDPTVVPDRNHSSRQDIPDRFFDVVVENDRDRGWLPLDEAAVSVFHDASVFWGAVSRSKQIAP